MEAGRTADYRRTVDEWLAAHGELTKNGKEYNGQCPRPECGGTDRFHVKEDGGGRARVGCRGCMDVGLDPDHEHYLEVCRILFGEEPPRPPPSLYSLKPNGSTRPNLRLLPTAGAGPTPYDPNKFREHVQLSVSHRRRGAVRVRQSHKRSRAKKRRSGRTRPHRRTRGGRSTSFRKYSTIRAWTCWLSREKRPCMGRYTGFMSVKLQRH